MTSAPSRCGLSDLPAPEVPLAATMTTSAGRAAPPRNPGRGPASRPSGSSRARRSAGRRQGRPGLSSLRRQAARGGRKATGRHTGCRRSSSTRPRRTTGSPPRSRERAPRRAAPPRARPTRRAGARGRRRRVWRAARGRRRLDDPPGQRRQVRVDLAEHLAGRGVRRHRTDLDLRVAEQQPEDLAPGVATRTRHCRRHHVHDHTDDRECMRWAVPQSGR